MAILMWLRWLFCNLLLLACLATCAFADSCVPVLVLATPSPEYSDLARRAGVQGTVTLQITLGPDGGTPRQIRVLRQLGWGLDEQAIQAVSQWRFRPVACQDKPGETTVPIECKFSGPKSGYLHFGSLSFDLPEEVRRPRLMTFVPPDFYPEWGKHYTEGTVQFTVSEQGLPENFHVEHAAGEDLDQAILRSLRDWRFAPADQEGHTLLAHGTLTYSAQNHP